MKVYYKATKDSLDEFMQDQNRYLKMRSAYSINFTSTEDIQILNEYTEKKGINGLEALYKTIGIKFDRILDENGTFIVDNVKLHPNSLATSERNLLYALICKELGKNTLIIGLLEGLDYEHRQVFIREFKNSDDNIELLIIDIRETIEIEDMLVL